MNYNTRYNSDYSVDNCNKDLDFDKTNKKQGCCIRYIQEVCCYPGYYNEYNKDDKFEDKKCNCKHNTNERKSCCNQNHCNNDYQSDFRPQNKCCCFNRLFRW